jgi:NAD kinase
MLRIDQSIVIVVRKTRLDALTAKFSTKGQARFLVTRARMQQAVASGRGKGAELEQVEQEALAEVGRVEEEGKRYQDVVAEVRGMMDFDLPVNVVDRSLVPNMVFGPRDIVVAIGQDGLVANVAKYAVGLPIVGVNPDPAAYDGILLPFEWKQARAAVQRTLEGRAKYREVSLAEAKLSDGQRLLAFNDLFIGARTHVSARYRLEASGASENQSSSGMIVSTGAGSTGWLSSMLNMAAGVMRLGGGTNSGAAARPAVKMAWEDRRLVYVVREPFVSKRSGATLVSGMLPEGERLTVESMMGSEGVIFSDGVEADALAFGEGVIATIGVAPERARLVVG